MQGKIWGKTETMIQTPFFEAHRLTILPRSFCSWHRHERKCNAFLVLTGTIFVKINREGSGFDETILGPGDMTTVAAGLLHRFETGSEPCEAYEFYYPTPLSEDIIRNSVGGRFAHKR